MKKNNLIITISLLLITNFVNAQLIYGIYNAEQIKNYIIVNLLGKQVASGDLVNETIDISQLERGFHFIKLSTSNNFVNNNLLKTKQIVQVFQESSRNDFLLI